MHNRKSPRTPGYDYRSPGSYFVTICTKHRVHYFGEVVHGQMELTAIGQCCHDEIARISERTSVTVDEWVVMPDHVHILLTIHHFDQKNNKGYRRDAFVTHPDSVIPGRATTIPGRATTIPGRATTIPGRATTIPGRATSTSLSNGMVQDDGYVGPRLGQIVSVFKSNVTKFALQQHISFARQGRYHDRIVRSEYACSRISNYIQDNPKKWKNHCIFA